MRKDLTEIVFILDRSGSMSGLEADTIGGFNSMIQKQKKERGRAVNYHADPAGTALNYQVLSSAISAVRDSRPLGAAWKKQIDEDYRKRGDGRK